MAHPANPPIADRIVLNLFLGLDRDGKKELTDLIASCKAKNTLIFGPGAVDLYFPSCYMPASFFPLTDAEINDRDLARINKQFEKAQQSVVLINIYVCNTTNMSKAKQNSAKFELDHKNTF